MMIVKSSSLKVPATCYLWLHIELDVNVTSPHNAHYQLLGKPQTRHVCTMNVPDAQGLWLLFISTARLQKLSLHLTPLSF